MPGKSKAEKYANIKKKKKEVSIEEITKDHPEEFRQFMSYCRELSFTQDPDYGYIIGLFEACLKRHGFDTKNPDFIWNKNRLALEKEAIKRQMLNVIKKKPKAERTEQ